MPNEFPSVPKCLLTSESENEEIKFGEDYNGALKEYSNDLHTEGSNKSKNSKIRDHSSGSISSDTQIEHPLNSSCVNSHTILNDLKSNSVEKLVQNDNYSIFSSSSDYTTNSSVGAQTLYSTPLLNRNGSNTQIKPLSLRRHFHNLSLRVFTEQSVEDEFLKPPSSNLVINRKPLESFAKSDSADTSVRNAENDGDDSDSFEALMARLRGSPVPVKNTEPLHGDFSFVVSDSVSSEAESSSDLNFYRRIENQKLQKSIKKVLKVRRRIRLESTSSEDSREQEEEKTDEEATEVKKADTSEPEELDYQLEMPSSVLLPPRRARRPCQSKSATSAPLKETGNVRQESDVYSTLPFIYSLDSIDKPSPKYRRHPSAERFVANFKKNREELANRLYAFYNEIVFDNKLPKDLKVQWNERLLKTAGQCIYMRRKVKNPDGSHTVNNEVKIELSGKVCTSAERVRDTLLHEACHAAVWLVHGVNDKHGRLWRAFVQRANSTFPGLPPVNVRHTYAIEARYTYRCTGCFATINRHSKSLDIQRKVCGRCKSRFQLFVNKKGKLISVVDVHSCPQSTTQNPKCGVEMTPRSKPVFAEFVKEHYKEVRGGASSHKDAMTQLGNLFRSLRVDPDKEN